MKDLGVLFDSELSFAFPVRHFPVLQIQLSRKQRRCPNFSCVTWTCKVRKFHTRIESFCKMWTAEDRRVRSFVAFCIYSLRSCDCSDVVYWSTGGGTYSETKWSTITRQRELHYRIHTATAHAIRPSVCRLIGVRN